ncbi:MAG: BCCT family transporter [Gracilimonas sp.]|nr:BCCT family transporter [Gracilimonas sp.]
MFSLFIAFSRFGNIRLGGDDADTDFSTMAWFADAIQCRNGNWYYVLGRLLNRSFTICHHQWLRVEHLKRLSKL